MMTADVYRGLSRGLIMAALLQIGSLVGLYVILGQTATWPPNLPTWSVLSWPVFMIFAAIALRKTPHRYMRHWGKWLLIWSISSLVSLVLGMTGLLGVDGAMILPLFLNLAMIGAAFMASAARVG